MKQKVKLYTFKCKQTFSPWENLDECIKMLNHYYFNDHECNHVVDGKLVSKYPEIEEQHPEIKDAHSNIRRGMNYKIEVDFYSDGTYKIKSVK